MSASKKKSAIKGGNKKGLDLKHIGGHAAPPRLDDPEQCVNETGSASPQLSVNEKLRVELYEAQEELTRMKREQRKKLRLIVQFGTSTVTFREDDEFRPGKIIKVIPLSADWSRDCGELMEARGTEQVEVLLSDYAEHRIREVIGERKVVSQRAGRT